MQEPTPPQATRGDMATVSPHGEQPGAGPPVEEVSKGMASLRGIPTIEGLGHLMAAGGSQPTPLPWWGVWGWGR